VPLTGRGHRLVEVRRPAQVGAGQPPRPARREREDLQVAVAVCTGDLGGGISPGHRGGGRAGVSASARSTQPASRDGRPRSV
jgi:hypothetical protein